MNRHLSTHPFVTRRAVVPAKTMLAKAPAALPKGTRVRLSEAGRERARKTRPGERNVDRLGTIFGGGRDGHVRVVWDGLQKPTRLRARMIEPAPYAPPPRPAEPAPAPPEPSPADLERPVMDVIARMRGGSFTARTVARAITGRSSFTGQSTELAKAIEPLLADLARQDRLVLWRARAGHNVYRSRAGARGSTGAGARQADRPAPPAPAPSAPDAPRPRRAARLTPDDLRLLRQRAEREAALEAERANPPAPSPPAELESRPRFRRHSPDDGEVLPINPTRLSAADGPPPASFDAAVDPCAGRERKSVWTKGAWNPPFPAGGGL